MSNRGCPIEDPAWVSALADRMTANTASGPLDVGYTYIGQFIAHDIVAPTHPVNSDRCVTAWLNLDSLYGDGVRINACGRFTMNDDNPADLLRDDDGVALIPEARNDENIIISQLHLFWQRLHNKFVDAGMPFQQARLTVILLFQWLVKEDYLRQIIHPKVYDLYFADRDESLYLSLPPGRIPIEFSKAAFRFGHSMVRSFYNLNDDHQAVRLENLFHLGKNLPRGLEIDWYRFFSYGNRGVEKAGKIDTSVVRPMARVPTHQGETDVVQANLRAGLASSLESGTQYVDWLLSGQRGARYASELGLSKVQEFPASLAGNLADFTLAEDLPLWAYLLVEAEIHSNTITPGRHLGVAGSLIVADVLSSAIAGADVSIDHYHTLAESLAAMGVVGSRLSDILSDPSRSDDSHLDGFPRSLCMRDILALDSNFAGN